VADSGGFQYRTRDPFLLLSGVESHNANVGSILPTPRQPCPLRTKKTVFDSVAFEDIRLDTESPTGTVWKRGVMFRKALRCDED
jgi:hypothetical protein